MSLETLEMLTKKYISEQPQGTKEVQFVWQGGEPMIAGIDFYKSALLFQQQYQRQGMVITNAIQTNGTLINNGWIEFIKENEFHIGLSLDGNEVLNSERFFYTGKSSFGKVINAFKLLVENNITFNVLTVVHQGNVNSGASIYNFLVENGAKNIQFLPDVNENTIQPELWGNFLTEVFEQWLENGLGKITVQHFDATFTRIATGYETFCVHASSCGSQLAVEINGDVYSCDHYVSPANKLGNINQASFVDMINSPMQQLFMQKSQVNSSECNRCSVRGLCSGGCPKHRDANNHNKLCKGYKKFFKYSAAYFISMHECLKRKMPIKSYNQFLPSIKVQTKQQLG